MRSLARRMGPGRAIRLRPIKKVATQPPMERNSKPLKAISVNAVRGSVMGDCLFASWSQKDEAGQFTVLVWCFTNLLQNVGADLSTHSYANEFAPTTYFGLRTLCIYLSGPKRCISCA